MAGEGAGGGLGGEREPAVMEAAALAQFARHYGAGSAEQAQVEREAEEDLCFELEEFADMASECKAMLALLQRRVNSTEAEGEPGDGDAEYNADMAVRRVASGGEGGALARSTLPVSPSSAGEREGAGDGGGSGMVSEDLLSVLSEQERSLLQDIFPL